LGDGFGDVPTVVCGNAILRLESTGIVGGSRPPAPRIRRDFRAVFGGGGRRHDGKLEQIGNAGKLYEGRAMILMTLFRIRTTGKTR
jgi:hypothetical protein